VRALFALAAAVSLAGCDYSVAEENYDICMKALDGVNTVDRFANCRKKVARAGWEAKHTAAQEFRDLPRKAN